MKYLSLGLVHSCIAVTLFACSSPNHSNKVESVLEIDTMQNHDRHEHESNAITMEADDFKSSRYTEVHEYLESTHFTIKYTAPVTKNRVIFGGLVAFDEVWVTGAHKATSIEFDKPVVFGSNHVEPGTYAIFTIPAKSEWTFILNNRYDQHLADDYNQEEDVLRMKVEPIALDEKVERLTYELLKSGDKHYLRIAWDTLAIEVPLSLSTN